MSNRIVYLAAGAGGMFCGSCLHDNALAGALQRMGWDVQLVPTYTPIRTDEEDVSVDQVFFGGINVFLQQKIPLLKHLPKLFDKFLDSPWLIKKVTSKAIETNAKDLGALTVSMLKGVKGNQSKEVKRLCKWLKNEAKPNLIVLTNLLIGGCVPEMKKHMDVPILVTLQGDDVFLDELIEPFRGEAFALLKEIGKQVDGFIVHTNFYADYMSEYLGVDREKFHVTPLGLDTREYIELVRQRDTPEDQTVIGYLARLAPEKGLHLLVDALVQMKNAHPELNVRLKIAGWLGGKDKQYANEQFEKLKNAEFDFEYLGSVDRPQKLDFLRSIDILSVPTVFREPKGLYVLEALAAGAAVVQPNHGSFPELLHGVDGVELFEANDPNALAERMVELVKDVNKQKMIGESGRKMVLEKRNADQMAKDTAETFSRFLNG